MSDTSPTSTPDLTARLEAMLAKGQDNLLLRFSLGKAYWEAGHWDEANTHLNAALGFDPQFSNAWKLLGRVRLARDDRAGARQAWEQGSAAATARGDAQVAREIAIFLKRLDKA